jgi:hypothetical protein
MKQILDDDFVLLCTNGHYNISIHIFLVYCLALGEVQENPFDLNYLVLKGSKSNP